MKRPDENGNCTNGYKCTNCTNGYKCTNCTDCIGGVGLKGVTGHRPEGYESNEDGK